MFFFLLLFENDNIGVSICFRQFSFMTLWSSLFRTLYTVGVKKFTSLNCIDLEWVVVVTLLLEGYHLNRFLLKLQLYMYFSGLTGVTMTRLHFSTSLCRDSVEGVVFNSTFIKFGVLTKNCNLQDMFCQLVTIFI